jgi:hypothetical protein
MMSMMMMITITIMSMSMSIRMFMMIPKEICRDNDVLFHHVS